MRSQVIALSGALLLIPAVGQFAAQGVPIALADTPARSTTLDPAWLSRTFERAQQLPRLHALLIAHHGTIAAEKRFRGPPLDRPVNIKSVSKSIVSALIGIAIGEGHLRDVQQSIAPYFPQHLRDGAGPRLNEITFEHLLTMQSGLARTSGESYAAWVGSKNWVAHILRQPLIAEPGSTMIYSTGNTHLLSAILTRATRKSTHAYARDRLAKPLGVELPPWQRDPQGIYIGGNQMRLSPRALVKFGELYRNGGRYRDRQIVPAEWVSASLKPRTRSIFSGQLYGYGWFIAQVAGHEMFFAWGYGGQFIFVIPSLALTVVTTSDVQGPRDFEHLMAIMDLLREFVVPGVAAADHADR